MRNPISDVFDTRELTKYILEIEDDLITDFEDYEGVDIQEISQVDLNSVGFKEYTSVCVEEYKTIIEFAEELKNYCSHFGYGATVIEKEYFISDYAKELVMDMGYIPRDFPQWIVIDWEETAENMMHNYTKIEFQDKTYLVR